MNWKDIGSRKLWGDLSIDQVLQKCRNSVITKFKSFCCYLPEENMWLVMRKSLKAGILLLLSVVAQSSFILENSDKLTKENSHKVIIEEQIDKVVHGHILTVQVKGSSYQW